MKERTTTYLELLFCLVEQLNKHFFWLLKRNDFWRGGASTRYVGEEGRKPGERELRERETVWTNSNSSIYISLVSGRELDVGWLGLRNIYGRGSFKRSASENGLYFLRRTS